MLATINWKPTQKELRSFGRVSLIMLTVIADLLWKIKGPACFLCFVHLCRRYFDFCAQHYLDKTRQTGLYNPAGYDIPNRCGRKFYNYGCLLLSGAYARGFVFQTHRSRPAETQIRTADDDILGAL